MLADVSRRGDVEIVFPVHLSPAVRESVFAELAGREHVHLMEPLDYHSFVHVLKSSDLVVTDSGGLQEEAPVFGIPVLVMRDTTERERGRRGRRRPALGHRRGDGPRGHPRAARRRARATTRWRRPPIPTATAMRPSASWRGSCDDLGVGGARAGGARRGRPR